MRGSKCNFNGVLNRSQKDVDFIAPKESFPPPRITFTFSLLKFRRVLKISEAPCEESICHQLRESHPKWIFPLSFASM